MSMLGDQLKAERERQGIVLEQVSVSTKIRMQYLEALERQDWDALPEPVFTRSYLHAYAQFLGMDPKSMLNAYGRELRISRAMESSGGRSVEADATKAVLERLAKTKGLNPSRSRSRTGWIVLGLVGACSGAVAMWTLLASRSTRPGERTATETRPPAALNETHAPAREAPAASTRQAPGTPAGETRGLIARETPGAFALSGAHGIARSQESQSPRNAREASAPSASAIPPVSRHVEQPVEPAVAGDGRLRVADHAIGTNVVDRQLVGRTDRFAEGAVAWFWTRVVDGHSGDTIQHVWRHEGRVMGIIKLNVGGAQWRTASRRRLPAGSTGTWTVEARDAEDRLLASADFTCVPAR